MTDLHVTYIGNFLSGHGRNPTIAEFLVPLLRKQGVYVNYASSKLHYIPRAIDILKTVSFTPRTHSCVIIDVFSGPRAFVAARTITTVCRLLRKKYILVLHGGGLPERWKSSREALLQMFEGAVAVVSPSPFLANLLSDYVDVEVIPNGISLENYPWRLREKVNPSFFYLRAFHKYYDPITAIKAFYLFRNEYGEGYLTMAGPDEDGTLAKCKALVTQLGLKDVVHFIGRILKPDIPIIGSKHDVFINSSLVDNTPVSTIEAMALGMCIVATSVGGLPYLLKDEETALLVPPGDPEAMACAMGRLVSEPLLARRLSTSARAVAEEMSWDSVLPKWMNLIQRAAK